jgi:hypothetical protein
VIFIGETFPPTIYWRGGGMERKEEKGRLVGNSCDLQKKKNDCSFLLNHGQLQSNDNKTIDF